MNNLIGQHLGSYRILERIGVGGMATVYKAYQPAMDRYVAVKVIATHFAQDETFLKRFRREAKAVAKLEHAHILPVYDSGEAEGCPYLVMRYLEAGTLKDRMSKEPLPLTEVNRIIGQIGSALDYAHRMGVVHRDVKPSNVLLDAEGDTFLTDFGLAKMMEASTQLTGTGVGVGTPAYMSPEQGKGARVDSRSDVYSLGVMLYEMVTGRAPYEAETPLAVVLKHIQEPLPLPRSVRPDLPEGVERVILRAMAKEPNDRFQTAGEMVRALDAAVRASEAAARTEPAAPAVREVAVPSAKGWVIRVRQAIPAGWGRVAAWGTVGLVALVILLVTLSRMPLRVQISGGQLDVVHVVEETPPAEAGAPATPLSTPTAWQQTTSPTPTPFVVRMRVRLTSTSDWVDVTLLPGSDVFNTETVETGGATTTAGMRGRKIEIDQSKARARAGDEVTIVQDLTLTGLVTEDQTLAFQVDKGCLGSLTVEIFNRITDAPVLVERFVIDGCNPPSPEYLSVAVGMLTTAGSPPSPTRPVEPDRGKTVFWSEDETPQQIHVRVKETGRMTQVTDNLSYEQTGVPSWSPDGTQILFPAGSTQLDHKLYIINADGSDLRQLTHGDSHDQEAEWSPDGQWVAFYRDCNLWRIRPDGSDEEALLVSGNYCTEIPTWSPDSRQIAFLYYQELKVRGIWVVNADGSEPHEVYSFAEPQPVRGNCAWSPDGRQLICNYWETRGGPQKHLLIETDGSGQVQPVDWFADWWGASFWPRWGVEE